MPYYESFLKKFPEVHQLAAADEADVLRLWQGLGYYSRARNLHECAKTIVSLHGGKFPSSYKSLLKLPGVGPYTAAAIASFAFDQPEAVVDGNVFRVLSRLLGIVEDIASSKGQRMFRAAAQELIDRGDPATYNQAIMEFGALQCTPKSPRCTDCPMSSFCYAFQHGKQHELPVKSKKVAIRHRFFHYGVFTCDRAVYLKPRTGKDIWQGMYDFHLIETGAPLETEEYLELLHSQQILDGKYTLDDVSGIRPHLLSHQKLHVQFYKIELLRPLTSIRAKTLGLRPYAPHKLHDLPKPVLVSRYLNECNF